MHLKEQNHLSFSSYNYCESCYYVIIFNDFIRMYYQGTTPMYNNKSQPKLFNSCTLKRNKKHEIKGRGISTLNEDTRVSRIFGSSHDNRKIIRTNLVRNGVCDIKYYLRYCWYLFKQGLLCFPQTFVNVEKEVHP